MKLNIEMSRVVECEVTRCAYNREQNCHARAITVGNGVHPACDTFYPAAPPTTDLEGVAGVGACKVSACQYNRDLECDADEIRIGKHEAHADCMTFSPRP
jgi:hypothetical protein